MADADLDILTGHKAISAFLGLTPRQVEWHSEKGELPTFKIGRTVCARRSRLLEWVQEQEQKQRERSRK
ncbi:hypothetical protein AKG11_30955 [Shinella sp. SUS2]|uniref:hypothetical protein n=1 Tax=unclassified Shinella TaxID=2643062 RepID=UPI000682845F|nr:MULTISPECIES: hypothetical protein [unclassified Shinella]KNY13095.1 hypothetical protein AKG11_30955 [Shinella sp. SUS2]KOC71880.1 hypothetical protein AKG10_30375 [Shinella sp. GWS1]